MIAETVARDRKFQRRSPDVSATEDFVAHERYTRAAFVGYLNNNVGFAGLLAIFSA